VPANVTTQSLFLTDGVTIFSQSFTQYFRFQPVF
jgi:hypothetical protein